MSEKEKEKIARVKGKKYIPKEIAELYERKVIKRLREKVKKQKKKNEEKAKKLLQMYGSLTIVRYY